MSQYAFPWKNWQQHPGMTLRDYFAGQAIVGLMPEVMKGKVGNKAIVTRAFEIADLMLEESAQEEMGEDRCPMTRLQ